MSIVPPSAPLPDNNVGTLGWKHVTFRGRKPRCAKCSRRSYVGVISFDRDPKDEAAPMVCRRCFNEMDPVE